MVVVDKLRRDIEGLKTRLLYPVAAGLPAAYSGEFTFQPQPESFLIDADEDGVVNDLVNMIVPSGQIVDIPVSFAGPGVFVARYLVVTLYQRVKTTWGVEQRPMALAAKAFATRFWTTKFSCLFKGLQGIERGPRCNFHWNIINGGSGRRYASDFMPGTDLQIRTSMTDASFYADAGDGGLFEFDCPWVFERGGSSIFQFLPVTDVYQLDKSITTASDVLESGTRNQAVTVTVEFHGHRYFTDQDAVNAGALRK